MTKYPNDSKMEYIRLSSEHLPDSKIEELLSHYFTHNGSNVKFFLTPEDVSVGTLCKVFDGHVEDDNDDLSDTYATFIPMPNSGFGFEGEYLDGMGNPL